MIASVFLISNEKDEFVPSTSPLRPLAFQECGDAQGYIDNLLHGAAKKMRIREYRLVDAEGRAVPAKAF